MSLAAGAPKRKRVVIQASDESEDEPLASAAKRVKAEEPAATSSAPVTATPNGSAAQHDSDSSDDKPLASTASNGRGAKDDSSDEDVPLAVAVKRELSSDEEPLGAQKPAPKASSSKPAAKKAKKVKKEESDDETEEEEKPKPKAKAKKAAAPRKKKDESATPVKAKSKGKGKAKKEENEDADDEEGDGDGEEGEEEHKWWKAAQGDGTIKWKSLRHNGVLFAPPYVPHGIKMKYEGQDVDLPPEAEEVATFFGSMLNTDHVQKPKFRQNFFHDFKEVLRAYPPLDGTKITKFEECDFKPIFEWTEAERERKKAMTKEEKKLAKQARDILEEPYKFAWLDGRKEKVGNFRIEPPSLFRGRGDHPKTGMLKRRVMPEQITINIGPDDPVPEPPAGHSWAKVTNDNKVTWLAAWNENINNANKYVFLSAGSSLKGQSDLKKFEKARELKKHIERIRKDYTADLTDKVMATRQRATALYLIDRFALRAGNEKGDDEADTVSFDFLGKDSIRYHQQVDVDEQVFKNMRIFKKNKEDRDELFDRLTTVLLNKHLGEYMKGLSAKVFRTYNASWTFQNQLDAQTKEDDSIADKILAYNRANRAVAILCNHQKSVSKTHGAAMEKMADKLRALKYQRMKLRHALFTLDGKNRKRHKELDEDESDMSDSWIEKHEEDLTEKAKEAARKKFEKDTEKAKAAGDDPPDEDTLKEKIKAADAELKRLKAERDSKDVEIKGANSEDKILQKIKKMDERIAAHRTAAIDKEEGKETSLSINYIDPRLTYAWCAKHSVPIEKMFSKTLREKFTWASESSGPDWRF